MSDMSDPSIHDPASTSADSAPTLVEFLTARLDEDERAAHAAAPGPWTYGDIESVAGGTLYDQTVAIASVQWDNARPDPRIQRFRPEAQADATGEHIARHDPARVLAEVAAKRAIVELHGLHPNCHADIDGPDYLICAICHDYRRHDAARWPCATLRALALPHADHPEYREEWKP